MKRGFASLIAAVVFPFTASWAFAGASFDCEITFSLDSADTMRSVQFDVDYSAAGGGINGSGTMASCALPVVDKLSAFYDDDPNATLSVGLATPTTVTGPSDLVVCQFGGALVPPSPSDFVVTVVDDYDALGIPGSAVCGAPHTGESPPYSRDALTVLQTAVGSITCPLCECDVNNSGDITAGDSQTVLRQAIGWPVTFDCGTPCGGSPATTPVTTSVGISVSVSCQLCGNGTVEGDEACDDGNFNPDDCCNMCTVSPQGSPCNNGDECGGDTCDDGECIAGTDPGPCNDGNPCTVETCDGACDSTYDVDETCDTGTKSSLSISVQSDPTKRSIKWKFAGGPEVLQSDLGDPTMTTEHVACIFDSSGGIDSYESTVVLAAGPLWVDKDPKGFQFKDPDAATIDGVTKAKLKTGSSGKPKLSFAAKGTNLELPMPFSADEFFDQDTRVTVQLHNMTSGRCWSSVFDSPTANTATKFKAKEP